jgi:hypothetical protein
MEMNMLSNIDGAHVTSFNFTPEEWELIKALFLKAEQEHLQRQAVSGNEGYKVSVEAILADRLTNRKLITLDDFLSS